MRIGKKVYRFSWLMYWHMEEQRAWLEDLAEQGFHLERLGMFLSVFSQQEPRNDRFRVEYIPPAVMERIVDYRTAGWEHMGILHHLHFFRQAADAPDVSEVFTDSHEYAATLKTLLKEVSVLGVVIGIVVLVQLALLLFMPFPSLLLDDLFFLFAGTILSSFLAFLFILGGILNISRIRKNVMSGILSNDYVNFVRFRNRLYLITFLLISVGAFAILGVSFTNYEELQFTDQSIPLIRLSEIDNSLKITPYNDFYEDHDDFYDENYIYKDASFFVPLQYGMWERAVAEETTLSGDTKHYKLNLYTHVNSARSDSIAEWLFKMLVADEEMWISATPVQLSDSNGFDSIWWYEDGKEKCVIARNGPKVAYVNYVGQGSKDTLVLLIHEKMAELVDP
jgi:hypothetical protein